MEWIRTSKEKAPLRSSTSRHCAKVGDLDRVRAAIGYVKEENLSRRRHFVAVPIALLGQDRSDPSMDLKLYSGPSAVPLGKLNGGPAARN
jgi:hypothetical protein